MIYIGCDVHKTSTMICVIDDETGEIARPYPVPTTELSAELDKYLGRCRIAIETSSKGMFVTRRLLSLGHDVLAVDAFKTKRLLEGLATAKTDKLDARGLAQLLSRGLLDGVRVWVTDDQMLQLRELCRSRDGLVKTNTSMRNVVRQFLTRHGHDCPYRDLCGAKARAWLADLADQLPHALGECLRCHLAVLEHLAGQIEHLSSEIELLAQDHETVQLLQTIPGIGMTLAAMIAAEIGDIRRFDCAGSLRSYSRLTPQVWQSGDRIVTGPLCKHGNRFMSWALIQAAGHFATNRALRGTTVHRRYQRVRFKHGCNPAKVHVARELATIIFAMLRDHVPFDITRITLAECA